MRILGIDCGSQLTGYGVIDTDGTRHTLVEAGVIRSKPAETFPQRLAGIAAHLRAVIEKHRPDEAAVEDSFHAVNARSSLKLAHVRGVTLLVMAECGLSVGEYPPAKVKAAITGTGKADKQQVAWMLKAVLGQGTEFATADASDAVAVAICHAVHASVGMRR